MIIYSTGVLGFEVDPIVLQGFLAQTYPSLLKWSSHVLTVAHIIYWKLVSFQMRKMTAVALLSAVEKQALFSRKSLVSSW